MKIFVEKACLFKAYKPLSLKSYAKESSLYGAILYVFHFRKSPGQSLRFTQFLLLSESVWAKLLIRKCLILIPLFLLKFFKNVV